MTTSTLSPRLAEVLRWVAQGFCVTVEGNPELGALVDLGLFAVREGSLTYEITDAGRKEAARLEEEGARRKGEQTPPPVPPPAAEPAPTVGGAIVGFIAQILMVPEGRKVAAGLIDSALDHLNRNREESRRVAEEIAAEKPAPAPATTERRAPKKGRRRRG